MHLYKALENKTGYQMSVDSPAPNMLMTKTTTKHIEIHAAGLISRFQKPTRMAAALSSPGMIIAQLYLTERSINQLP